MMNKPLTILIHGLHMNHWYTKPLEQKIRASGFPTHRHNYHSLSESIAQHGRRLHDYLTAHHDQHQPINLVGHSLGGLVIRHFIHHYPNWQVHRCVSLGTPHQGSICASYAKRYHLGALVKHALFEALDGRCPAISGKVEFGVIAGNKPIGLGVPFLAWHSHRHRLNEQEKIHDGTVYLFETPLANASDYLILPTSHTGLLTDKQTAHQVIHFLENGRFDHS